MAFCKGLQHLGMVDLIQQHPGIMKDAFVFDAKSAVVTSETFTSLITAEKPVEESCLKAYTWFLEYVEQPSTNLPSLLAFATGLKSLPPMGLKNKITLEYLPCNDHFALPGAQACFGVVKLPTVLFEAGPRGTQ